MIHGFAPDERARRLRRDVRSRTLPDAAGPRVREGGPRRSRAALAARPHHAPAGRGAAPLGRDRDAGGDGGGGRDHRRGRNARSAAPDVRRRGPARALRRARDSCVPPRSSGDPLELAAIGLSHGRHYRVVDVKFKTLNILKTTGGLSTSPSDLDTLAQAWVYNEALGRMQGYTPPASYVVGRAWKQGDERGDRTLGAHRARATRHRRARPRIGSARRRAGGGRVDPSRADRGRGVARRFRSRRSRSCGRT